MRIALAVISNLLLSVPAMTQEAEVSEDERGIWFAEINPTTKDMFMSDCPCESSPSINFTCGPKSGSALVEIADFLGAKGNEGDAATVTFDIDGAQTTKEGKLAKFAADLQPVFNIDMSDPLFDALANGKSARLEYKGTIAETKLQGSGKAIATMRDYCAKP
jgi:hypothetical protein